MPLQVMNRRPPKGGFSPISMRMFHCSALTGVTDSRDWRTSAISASLSSALISASVTGLVMLFTAFTVTMPKRPLASVGSG